MNDMSVKTESIVVDEVFPHAPEIIWKALTTSELIARWLHMPTTGFAAVKGTHFTFKTTPAGAWDGFIRCEVLEVIANERLAFSWRGGDESNAGYGSKLDTVVTWTLTKVANGTRVRLVHSGFVLPKNETAYTGMSDGWKKVVPGMVAVAVEQESAKSLH